MSTDNSIRYAVRRKSDGRFYKKTRWHEPSWVDSTTKAKLYLSPITAKDANLFRFCWTADLNHLPWQERKAHYAKLFHAAYEVVPVQLTFNEIG